MALTLRGESFSMPLGDPLPMEREGGCSEDQLGLDLPQPETNATACGAVSGHIRSLRVSQLRGL